VFSCSLLFCRVSSRVVSVSIFVFSCLFLVFVVLEGVVMGLFREYLFFVGFSCFLLLFVVLEGVVRGAILEVFQLFGVLSVCLLLFVVLLLWRAPSWDVSANMFVFCVFFFAFCRFAPIAPYTMTFRRVSSLFRGPMARYRHSKNIHELKRFLGVVAESRVSSPRR